MGKIKPTAAIEQLGMMQSQENIDGEMTTDDFIRHLHRYNVDALEMAIQRIKEHEAKNCDNCLAKHDCRQYSHDPARVNCYSWIGGKE